MAEDKSSSKAEVEYREFVAATASKVPRFLPLNAFLQIGCIDYNDLAKPRGITRISCIVFRKEGLPSAPIETRVEDLADSLADDKDSKVYIVENISASVAALFGGAWNVDPQFFLDYLDNAPWWRIVDVEPHLDALPSVRRTQYDHVAFKFVAPREFDVPDAPKPSCRLPDRLEAVQLASGVKRIGGGLNPLPRDGMEFDLVGLFRTTAAAWFDSGLSTVSSWKKCIVLLDPPFKTSEDVGTTKFSKYRSFTARPMMSSVQDRNIDDRTSYRTTLVHCFRHNGLLHHRGVPPPLLLLQDLYRLIACEWATLHTYLERDLSTIEWRLENKENANLEVLELFMEHLFIFRRRIFKYRRLVDEQLQSILVDHPTAWDSGQQAVKRTKQLLAADFARVQRLFDADTMRIHQIFSIIMPLISIRDGKASIAQNRSLGFLTALATILLPFNAVAAILAIPNSFGPEGDGFWVFWIASCVVCGVVLVSFLLYRLVSTRGRRRRLKRAKSSKVAR